MGLGGIGRMVIRPWVVLLLGLLLTGVAAAVSAAQFPNQFQATARLLLLLPPESSRPSINPFLDQPNGLVVLASVISAIPYSDGSHLALEQLGLDSQFEIGLDPSVPVITLSVEGEDPDDVTETRDWIVARLEEELLRVQQEEAAPGRHLATSRLFMAEAEPHVVAGDTSRGVVGVLGAGCLLSVLAAAAAGRSRSRRPRHGAAEVVSR